MNLVIDIGNTRTKAGIFKGPKLIETYIIQHDILKALRSFAGDHSGIKNAILSTTVDYSPALRSFLKKNFAFTELSEKTPLPFRNAYKTPATLGKDRLASVAGAWKMFHGKPVLVINAGTCITYDTIDSKGTYYGGAISPGLEMRFKALHTFTDRLPLVDIDPGFNELTGTNTRESILSGVQKGMTEEIQGFINAYKKQYKNLHVMLTGGSMNWLKMRLAGKIISEPFLTLKGLNVILTFKEAGKN